jgi:class 3 adenylate cyclase
VFTDVTGFSKRVEEEESVTLALLERDFVAMRLFAKAHSGTVIKSTGDGLMLYFTSAVEAVEWALKTQRHFTEQATALSASEVLHHRIGIHLGDVFVGSGDVMGDGVNVAARVQSEARPGGICISQVVYDLVKNKLKLDVIRLEPRKLKNIAQSVQMYHVLLEPPSRQPVATAPAVKTTAAPPPRSSSRSFAMIAVLVVGVAAAGFFFYQARLEHEKELASSEQMRRALSAAAQRTEKKEETVASPPATPTQTATAPTPAAPSPARPPSDEINFLKLTTRTPAATGVSPGQDRAVQQARACIPALDTWRVNAFQAYTKDRAPLTVRPLRGPQAWTVFTDATHQICFAQGGAVRKQAWAELKPEVQGAIIASLLLNSGNPAPREVVRGAEAFAFLNGLPELAALLVRE